MELAFIPKKEFMQAALALAREAAAAGEVPVGAVVVGEGKILGKGRNRMEAAGSALAHAELEAIGEASRALGTWRLTGCHLYVTLEPCPMCAGAILNSHIAQLVYGPDDERAGSAGTACDVLSLPIGRRPGVYRGFLEEECRALLQGFFKSLRP